MLTHDYIRFDLLRARKLADAAARAKAVEGLLVDALVDARRNADGVTESVMTDRYGFTAAEIVLHRRRALDRATVRWMTKTSVDSLAA